MSDVTKTIEELGGLVAGFKKVNDEILAAQKDGNGRLGELKTVQGKIEERLNIVEAAQNKVFLGNQAQKNEADFTAKEMQKLGSRYMKAVADLNKPEYKEAFLEVISKGEHRASPEAIKVTKEFTQKSMFVADDATGGIFAPPEFINVLIRDIVEISPWRSLVTVRNTTKRSIWQPKRTRTAKAVRGVEGGTQNETQNPLFAPIEVPAEKCYARVDISDEDLEDPVFNLEAFMREEWAEQFAYLEGYEVTVGSGVGECTGIVTDTTIPELTSTVSGSLAADDLIKLLAIPKSGYSPNFTWVMNRATISLIRRLKDSANRYLWDMGFNAGPSAFAQGAPMTILGAPVVEIPDMPNVAANNYAIAVGDFKRGYTIVDRINLSVLRDIYSGAANGMVRIFARKRFGGKPVQQEAMAKLKILT